MMSLFPNVPPLRKLFMLIPTSKADNTKFKVKLILLYCFIDLDEYDRRLKNGKHNLEGFTASRIVSIGDKEIDFQEMRDKDVEKALESMFYSGECDVDRHPVETCNVYRWTEDGFKKACVMFLEGLKKTGKVDPSILENLLAHFNFCLNIYFSDTANTTK